jgi:hypothetical protein
MVNGVKADDFLLFFETENNLPIAAETEIKQDLQRTKSTSTMSDYQEVDGIFPFSINQGG